MRGGAEEFADMLVNGVMLGVRQYQSRNFIPMVTGNNQIADAGRGVKNGPDSKRTHADPGSR